ncbi:hypothetical protein ACAW74_04110 [Fibrella sp. WM1]|uniref:hypothetical protein n=1 Tax=Fibrella musci TaxID=3242485 RepID=UPI0035218D2D
MNSSIIERFEEALANMSEADFDTFWQEVQQESGTGPLAAAFVADFSCSPAAHRAHIRYTMAAPALLVGSGEYNFAMAA